VQRVDDACATRIDRPEALRRQGVVVVSRMHRPPVVERRLDAGDAPGAAIADLMRSASHAVAVSRSCDSGENSVNGQPRQLRRSA
jgi:hypothetical protein